MSKLHRNWNPDNYKRIWVYLLKTYGPVCQWCFQRLDFDVERNHPLQPTIDHTIALSDGGINKLENLQPMHKICNEEKEGRYVGISLRRNR